MTDTSRLEALEFKTSFLERTVQELSDALYRQQQDLDRLREQHRALLRHVEQLAKRNGGGESTEDETPPHY